MINSKEQRIKIYKDTMMLCKNVPFLKNSIKTSVANTIIYPADNKIKISGIPYKPGNISVTQERSFEAAMNLHRRYPDKKIAVHNFASATNPGGGVERGSNAQEESLCRCSTLYPCLTTDNMWDNYYLYHRNIKDVRYTDTCVYIPGVYIIKTDTDNPEVLPEQNWVPVDIITCAAPNLRKRPNNAMNPGTGFAISISNQELYEIHTSRAIQIIKSAIANQASCLVLGAFGCGAFCNNPAVVALAYKKMLKLYHDYFDEIVFAVYCSQNNNSNYNIFYNTLI